MIDYYQLLMAAQQGAPEGARWHHDPAVENQWRYSQPAEYVPAPDQQTPQYQPITPPRRADLYQPMSAPVSAYDGLPPPEEIAAAVEQALGGGQQPAPVAMPQQQNNSDSGNSYPTASPVWDAPQGPANVIGYQQPGAPIDLSGYGQQGQPWSTANGMNDPGGYVYGGTDQPFTANANSHSNPYTGGGGGGFSFW